MFVCAFGEAKLLIPYKDVTPLTETMAFQSHVEVFHNPKWDLNPIFMEERKISHYSTTKTILLVGEGDFSFSSALATAFGSAVNLIATSLDSLGQVLTKYPWGRFTLANLFERGAFILHNVDATKMAVHPFISSFRFDTIVWNLPHAGFFAKSETDDAVIEKHKTLLDSFFRNASILLEDDGEVHVSHQSHGPYKRWELEKVAQLSGLELRESVPFCPSYFRGYRQRRGVGKNASESFALGTSKTYKFVHSVDARKRARSPPTVLEASVKNFPPTDDTSNKDYLGKERGPHSRDVSPCIMDASSYDDEETRSRSQVNCNLVNYEESSPPLNSKRLQKRKKSKKNEERSSPALETNNGNSRQHHPSYSGEEACYHPGWQSDMRDGDLHNRSSKTSKRKRKNVRASQTLVKYIQDSLSSHQSVHGCKDSHEQSMQSELPLRGPLLGVSDNPCGQSDVRAGDLCDQSTKTSKKGKRKSVKKRKSLMDHTEDNLSSNESVIVGKDSLVDHTVDKLSSDKIVHVWKDSNHLARQSCLPSRRPLLDLNRLTATWQDGPVTHDSGFVRNLPGYSQSLLKKSENQFTLTNTRGNLCSWRQLDLPVREPLLEVNMDRNRWEKPIPTRLVVWGNSSNKRVSRNVEHAREGRKLLVTARWTNVGRGFERVVHQRG